MVKRNEESGAIAVPTGTQKITVYVLVVHGLQGQLEMRER